MCVWCLYLRIAERHLVTSSSPATATAPSDREAVEEGLAAREALPTPGHPSAWRRRPAAQPPTTRRCSWSASFTASQRASRWGLGRRLAAWMAAWPIPLPSQVPHRSPGCPDLVATATTAAAAAVCRLQKLDKLPESKQQALLKELTADMQEAKT